MVSRQTRKERSVTWLARVVRHLDAVLSMNLSGVSSDWSRPIKPAVMLVGLVSRYVTRTVGPIINVFADCTAYFS
jgi:hypothetical protein